MANRRQGNDTNRIRSRAHLNPVQKALLMDETEVDAREKEQLLKLIPGLLRAFKNTGWPDVNNGPSLPPIKTLEPVKRDEELPPGMGYVTGDQGAKRPERFSSGTIPGPQIDDFPVSKKLKPEKVPIRRKMRMR